MKTLKELKEIRDNYLQQAWDEQIPQKAIQVASLGEVYISPFHGNYRIFPMLYGSNYAVFTHHTKEGKLIKHGEWEQVDQISVYIHRNFNPYKVDPWNQIPVFWNGLQVLKWTVSNVRTELLDTDIFIPGKWWEQAQEYLPEAESKIQKAAKAAQEVERQELHEKLLIGKQI